MRGLSKSVDHGIDERQECRRKFDALIDERKSSLRLVETLNKNVPTAWNTQSGHPIRPLAMVHCFRSLN